jgi:hypothetical protein
MPIGDRQVSADDRHLVEPGCPSHAFEHLLDDRPLSGHRVHQSQRPGSHRREVIEVGGHRGHAGAIRIGRRERRKNGFAAHHQGHARLGHHRPVVTRAREPVGALEDLTDQPDLGLGGDARM